MVLKTIKILFILSPLWVAGTASAYKAMTREEYIALHKDDAVRDMKKTGVPASITMAQALLESDDGNSPLAREANNHFGIKCTSDWTGPSYKHDDDRKNECFRKYKNALDSYDDHSYFLKTRPRYAFLFDINKSDYKKWAKGLKKAGYATNPKYADQLIKIVEDFQLYKLDADNEDRMMASAATPAAAANTVADSKTEEASIVPAKPVTFSHPKKIQSNYVDPFNQSRIVMNNNGVPYIIAKKGDTYEAIAKQYEMMPFLIYKYNDVSTDAKVTEGQMIYIKPKLRSAGTDFYVAKAGDTMQSISQQFGIKMKMLYKRNDLEEGTEVRAGQTVWLNKKKS